MRCSIHIAAAACALFVPALASAAVFDDFSTATPGVYPLTLPTNQVFVEAFETNPTVFQGERLVSITNRAFSNYTGPFQPFMEVSGGTLNYTAPTDFRGIVTSAYGFSSGPTFDLTAGGATGFVVDLSSLSLPNGGAATLRFDIRSANTTGTGGTDTTRGFDITGPGVYSQSFAGFNPGIDITTVNWASITVLTPLGGTFSMTSFGDNAVVPEPASFAAMAVSGTALLRRRRR